MKVFLSWSGPRSQGFAEAIRNWLLKVIQNIQPWMSATDIEKGSRWLKDIADKLNDTDFGIICLTPENIKSEWILFECGALSKAINQSFICPILFGLKSYNLLGPLSQFQSTVFEKSDMLKLVRSINRAMGDKCLAEPQLEETFEVWWPKLEKNIKEIPSIAPCPQEEQTERELLIETLRIVRSLERRPEVGLPDYSRYDGLKRILEAITPREEKILRMKFQNKDGSDVSVKEIADLFGMSIEQVEVMAEKSIRKLVHVILNPQREVV